MSTRSSAATALRPAPTAYGTSYWLDRVGRRPAPATRLGGDVETDVAVVGGGLTGCLTACLFARAGVPVVLLEAERIGDRAALDAGWLLETPGVDFVAIASAFGIEATSVDSLEALRGRLAEALNVARPSLVRVVVPDHGADEQNRALFRAVEEAAARRT